MPAWIDIEEIQRALREAAPTLWQSCNGLASQWMQPVLERLQTGSLADRQTKSFRDPVWNNIELRPQELILLDSPMLQRLRGVRQLGAAHLVFPAAGHGRLEHVRGVVEAADRMIASLERKERMCGRHSTVMQPPPVDPFDTTTIRLAALLHDIGHGPLSHATEGVMADRHDGEFRAAQAALADLFRDIKRPAFAELLAVLLVASPSVCSVLTHTNFAAGVQEPSRIAPSVIARILGALDCVMAPYVATIVSGPIDADKLDYMARDAYHSGLPIATDVERLIAKLEVVVLRPDRVEGEVLRQRVEEADGQHVLELGLEMPGLPALEQMVVNRVFLYERMYFHHKVRAAEAVVRRLIEAVEDHRGQPLPLDAFLADHGDDAMLDIFGGMLTCPAVPSGGDRARRLAEMTKLRRLPKRAAALAPRFIAGLDSLPQDDQDATRARIGTEMESLFENADSTRRLEDRIVETANRVRGAVGYGGLPDLERDDVFIDSPMSDSVATNSADVLVRTQDGYVAPPKLILSPQNWSTAYQTQKHVAFVYAPERLVPLVNLATRLVLALDHRIFLSPEADRFAKVDRIAERSRLEGALDALGAPADMRDAVLAARTRLAHVAEADLRQVLPDEWLRQRPDAAGELTRELRTASAIGFVDSDCTAIVTTVGTLAHFVDHVARTGTFTQEPAPSEADFQRCLVDFLSARGERFVAGNEVGGGETDVVLEGRIVVENKVVPQSTDRPFDVVPNAAWQARAYGLHASASIVFTVAAFRPADASAVPLPCDSIGIEKKRTTDGNSFVHVRFVIPFGQGTPSRQRGPRPPRA